MLPWEGVRVVTMWQSKLKLNVKERVMDWFTVAGIALLLAVALVIILWR